MIRPCERSKFPLPKALSRECLERDIETAFPDEFGRLLKSLVRPAICLWPRPAPADLTASRFGGKPFAPKDWVWPDCCDEPMLFIAQIDCAALRGTRVASLLPPDGLLSFFGDPDLATGCAFGGSQEHGAVFHWPSGAALVPRDPPEPDVQILPSAAIEFLETFTLPDLFSREVGERSNDRDFRMRYPEQSGIDSKAVNPDNMSQLLGWHGLVQQELDSCDEDENWRVLLQIGTYDNGVKDHWWGPGGSLYFMIREDDLSARRFDRVVFDGQFS